MNHFANNGKLKLLIIVGTRPEMVRRWLEDETAVAGERSEPKTAEADRPRGTS